MEFDELVRVLCLSLHLPSLLSPSLLTLWLLALLELDIASTGIGRPAESAATIEGLEIVLTEVTAGGEAAARGEERGAIVTVGGVGAC